MKVDIYKQFSPSLEQIWRRFEADCDHWVFQCYDWLAHWQREIGCKQLLIQPLVLVVTDRDELVALFPFGIRSAAGIRILEFLGGGQADYNAPLIRPDHLLVDRVRAIWSAVEKELPQHDVRSFVRLIADLNHSVNPWPAILCAVSISSAYSARLPSTITAFDEKLSARSRADSKRQLKRLSSLGELKFYFAESDAEHRNIVEALITQKRRRYHETGVRDTLSSKETQNFYLGLSGQLGEKGRIQVSALSLNGEILATHWGAISGGRYYWLMPAYISGKWEKFSAGRLLLEHNMRWAIDHGVKVFDFTTGDEAYKKSWCDKYTFIYEHLDYFSMMGMIFVRVQRIINHIKRNSTSSKLITSVLGSYRRQFKE